MDGPSQRKSPKSSLVNGRSWSGEDGAGRGGDEPTLDTQHGRLSRRGAAGSDEADAGGVGGSEAVGSCAVGIDDWLEKAGVEVGVGVWPYLCGTLQHVFVGEEELQPAPNADVAIADLADALRRFTVREDPDFGQPKVSA